MLDDVDLQRVELYREALALYKIKTLADAETFLMRGDISPREKVETLYIIYECYDEMLTYIDERIEKIKVDFNL